MSPTDIRHLRERMQLTQQGFASLLGLSFVSVNRWENGHSSPTGLSEVLLTLLSAALEAHHAAVVVSRLRAVGPQPIQIIRVLSALEARDV